MGEVGPLGVAGRGRVGKDDDDEDEMEVCELKNRSGEE